jgi:hypothetical protein
MKRKTLVITSVTVIGLMLAVPRPAKALFDIGTILILSEIYSNAVQQYTQLKMEVSQIVANAKHFSVKTFLRSVGNNFLITARTQNTHGETATWDERINGTNSPNHAASSVTWKDATVAIENDPYLSAQPLGRETRLANLAAIEIADSAGISALTTLGQTSQSQQKADAALNHIEQLAQDTGDGTNSTGEQLNLISSGSVQNLRYLQTLITLQKAQLQIEIAKVKIERDKQADVANFNAEVDTEFATVPAEWGNAAQSFMQERIP